ncbi:uncharacterized protein METZ01_LOCUS277845, partial [marine metagenome]
VAESARTARRPRRVSPAAVGDDPGYGGAERRAGRQVSQLAPADMGALRGGYARCSGRPVRGGVPHHFVDDDRRHRLFRISALRCRCRPEPGIL